ncbi:DUF1109 domain-containing protein [Sphingomonas sp.]|uniref:DUF1109 domain-containing protein n=1 Tax=Sphingomonas sp. TaxID=28214 RepID=UPI00286A38E5|nr:DUF1109 domain-containing protein [Sphingomonas sp.]
MPTNPNFEIAALVDDLRPARAMKVRTGLALTGMVAVAVILSTILLLGLRPDVAAGRFQPLFLFANGLFLIVALGTALAAIRMGLPRVGQSSQGWKSVVTALGLLPVAALIMLVSRTELMPAVLVTSHELKCVAMGLALGLVNAAVLVWWLRRGAPTSPERAGLLVGLSSGAVGIFAFAFHCPFDSFYHVGLWHMVPLVLGAMLGRLVVPPLVRW